MADIQTEKAFQKKSCLNIYAAGFSMGGGMSNYIGCFLADQIAVFAPSAFDLAKEIAEAGKCKSAHNFPGSSDNIYGEELPKRKTVRKKKGVKVKK